MGLGLGMGLLGLGGGVHANFTPLNLPGLVCYLDARFGVAVDANGLLTSWSDQSGQGNGAAPSGGGVTHSAKLISSWSNAKPALLCSSTGVDVPHGANAGTSIVTPAFVGGSLATFTIVIIGDKTSAATQQVFADGISATNRAIVQQLADNTISIYQGGAFLVSGAALDMTVPRCLTALFASDGANDGVFNGGTRISGPGNAGAQALTGLTVSGVEGGGFYLDGHVAAAIVCSGTLSGANITKVATWANSIWGSTP